jgi:tetratricopeptide (TPR) repeat protein
VAILAVGLVLLAYLPSLGGPFFTDDHAYVVDNAALRTVPLDRPWRLFVERTNPFEYLPLRDLSYRIDLALFGEVPAGFKAHNLLLYALCCWLVWLTTTELVRFFEPDTVVSRHEPGRATPAWVAAIATALFAAHPAHVESVAWISGRKDLVSGVGGLAALWCFVAGVRRDRRTGWLVASVACFALALLGKATVLPLMALVGILLLGVARARRHGLGALVAVGAMAVVALGALALHTSIGAQTDVLRAQTPSTGAVVGDWLPARILGALTGIALAPVRLRLIYDIGGGGLARLLDYVLAVLATAGAAWGLWRMRRGGSLPSYGLVFFTVMCVPFLQIVPYRTWSLASERFLFLPVLGVALAVAWLLARARRLAGFAVGATLFALLLAGTFDRSVDWRSADALLAGTSRLSPRNHLAVEWGVDAMIERRSFDEALAAASGVRVPAVRTVLEDYVRARRALDEGDRERAAELVRGLASGTGLWNSPVFRSKVGDLALAVGENAIAEREYRKLVDSRPDTSGTRYNLALALERLDRKDEAAEQLRLAVESGDRRGDVWNRLGLLERDLGRIEASEQAFVSGLRDDPVHWHAAYNLGRLYLSLGRSGDALRVLREGRTRAVAAGRDPAPIDRVIAGLPRDEESLAGD